MSRFQGAWAAVGLLASLIAVTLFLRPPLPIDETRYLTVAWEMFRSGDFLVPHLNGEPYPHKPPLLFWLIGLAWTPFGVGEWAGRLVAPIFALAALPVTAALARALWPNAGDVARHAPVLLAGSAVYLIFAGTTYLDMVLVLTTLVGLLGVVRAGRDGRPWGWIVFGVALGLGILTKGPVALIHLLPAPLLAPLWLGPLAERRRWGGWYAGTLGGVVFGVAIALAWAVPAARGGGEAYANAILWGQTAERITGALAHGRPWYWYLPLLPVLLYPYAWWPPVWRALARARGLGRDPGIRFCFAWLVPAFVVFSLIGGKQPHYLLPLVPALALIAGWAMAEFNGTSERFDGIAPALAPLTLALALLALVFAEDWLVGVAPSFKIPPWFGGINPLGPVALLAIALYMAWPRLRRAPSLAAPAIGCGLVAVIALGIVVETARAPFDLRPVANFLGNLERSGHPLSHPPDYEGQFHFLGRLEKPFAIIDPSEGMAWAAAHPEGYFVAYARTDPASQDPIPVFRQPFRGRWIAVWDAQAVRASNAAVLVER